MYINNRYVVVIFVGTQQLLKQINWMNVQFVETKWSK